MKEDCYFCYSNTTRRSLLPGEQAFLRYGIYTNKIWLTVYGFALRDSPYNSLPVYLNCEPQENQISLYKHAGWQKAKLKLN
jgi:hypothetical protein